jgi:hypothetical protein
MTNFCALPVTGHGELINEADVARHLLVGDLLVRAAAASACPLWPFGVVQ